jgi:hypothetical protein
MNVLLSVFILAQIAFLSFSRTVIERLKKEASLLMIQIIFPMEKRPFPRRIKVNKKRKKKMQEKRLKGNL